MTVYRGIVADPPWPEKGGGKIKRGADRHYKVVKLADIPAVIKGSPLWRPDPSGCFVWLWCPSWRVAVGQAADVLRALGARPVRKWTWVKGKIAATAVLERRSAQRLLAHGVGYLQLTPGIGQYGRGTHEDLVLGVIGKLRPLPAVRKILDTLVADHPRDDRGLRIHSAKPPEMYERVRAATPGLLAALFERIPRPGFDTWGDLDGPGKPPRVERWRGGRDGA